MSDENSGRKTEFSVRVIIYEGRRLSGSNPRPVVRVRCGELNQKSTKVEKGSSVIWNKEMMFNIESEEKELHKVLMEFIVNDSKRLRSDSIIGSYKLDLGSVYNRTSQKSGSTDHSYLRHWMLLTDPEDFANMPQGYLKVSIIVQGPGDLLPTDSGDDPDDDITKNLLMPAGVTFQHASFTLRVYQAEDLPDMDKIPPTETGKKPDTFLQFSYGGRKEKTEPISNKSSPEWNEELILPVKYPTMCTEIHLEIYDQDVGSDEKIGSVDILLSEISVKESDYGFLPTFGPTFFNIYQKSKRSHSSSIVSQDFLKNAKSDANYVGKYVGRVLVELVTGHEAIEKPLKREISTRQLEAVKKFKNKVDYRLIAVFHDAGMIDKSQANKSIKFEVSIGNNTQYVKCDLFKGDPYYSIPSKSHKPVVSMTSKWEIVEFRYAALNFLLGMVHELEENIEYIKDKMEKNKKRMEKQEVRKEISFCIIEAINDLQKISKFCELNPQDIPEANTLDRRLHQTRKWVVNDIIEKAEKLKNEATKEDDAIEELKEYLKQIKDLSYECQNSIPDVMIEMHVNGGKSGVASIPVHEIIYNEKGEQFSGKYCGRVQTILLRSPDDKNYKISCCLQVSLWLGRVETQEEIASVGLHLQRLATKEGWETKKENSDGWLMKRGTTEKEIHREILSREVPPSIHFPTAIKLHMRVYLYQAQNLPPIARRTLFERTLLVYVSFMNKSTKFVTPQGGDASNPLWNKTIKLDMEYYGDPYRLRYHCPELFLEVVSKDSIGCLEFLGRASFKPVLTDFDADKEEPEKPALEWRPFTTKTGDNGGDVLASAQIFFSDDNQIESEVPSDMRPELKQTHIKLLVWGLRNLKSFRGLNIVRPHVEISIGSIEFKSESLPNVKSEPNFKENEFNFKAVRNYHTNGFVVCGAQHTRIYEPTLYLPLSKFAPI